MIKIENYEVVGWEHAIRGMRNPKNSWHLMDSEMITQVIKSRELMPGVEVGEYTPCDPYFRVGPNDKKLMMQLAKGGPVHAKYRRMITVYVDITAPLYWWKEFDTYKVGTVANSCSTMHKIHEKEFTFEDFSCEYLMSYDDCKTAEEIIPLEGGGGYSPIGVLGDLVGVLNQYRKLYIETKDKKYWWQMIQLLPSSYNQKRTIMLNYEVLVGIYESRKNHKLDEWREFCKWIEELPYSELIIGGKEE